MSDAHHYWIVPCAAEPVGACVLAAAVAGVPYHVLPHRDAAGARAVVKVPAGTVAPEAATVLDFAAWSAAQVTAEWVAFQSAGQWTGTEQGALVLESAATTYPDGCLGDWSTAERVIAEGVPHRLVRYSGTKPDSLSGYAVLYAAEVLAIEGGV